MQGDLVSNQTRGTMPSMNTADQSFRHHGVSDRALLEAIFEVLASLAERTTGHSPYINVFFRNENGEQMASCHPTPHCVHWVSVDTQSSFLANQHDQQAGSLATRP